MNKRLLFSAALVAAISVNEAKAQEHVTEPALPSPVNLKLDGTDTVAIKNIKADMWLVNGNAWDTQASLSSDTRSMGIAIVPVEGKSGVFTLFNNNTVKNTDFKNKIFFNSSDSEGGIAYVDYASQGIEKTYWEVHLKNDGTFQLQADTTATSNSKYTSGTRAGYNPDDNRLDGQGNEVKEGYANFRPVLVPGAGDYGLDFQAYPYEYVYRKDVLMPAINDAIDAHADCDFSAVVKVYNDSDAKLWELKNAYKMINDIIRNKAIADANPTADNPYDMTQYITNANCDALSGWDYDCVYDSDGNVGSGGHGTNWQAHSSTYTSKDGQFTTSKFIERWVNSSSNPDTGDAAGTGHLSDGYISQTLRNLPAGGYRVSCYAMATQQAKSDYSVEGVSLFAKSGDTEKNAAVATAAGVPEKFTFLVAVEDGQDLTVGFKLDNTTANWVFVDEFKVEYYGSDAAMMTLVDMQSVAETLLSEVDGYAACPTYIEKAKELCNQAIDMTTSNTEEEITAMKKQLEDVQTLINTSIDKYLAFEDLYTEIDEFLAQGGESEEVSALGELVNDCGIGESMDDLRNSYTLDNDELDAYTAKLKEALAAARNSVIEPGSDVTYKITNPSFTDKANGWTSTNSPVTNTSYENTEKYEGTFDMHQELTGLPSGVYEVSVQAMHRHGSNADASARYENGTEDITAYLYANDLTTKFASPYSASMSSASGGSPADYEYNGAYIPNSMQGFKAACDANADNYKVSLNVLVTDGTLRIGVKEENRPSPSGADWAIWDNFKLTYVGNNQEAIDKVSGPVIKQAETLYDSKMSAEVLAALKDAVSAVQTEGKASTISALSAAIKDAEASVAVYKTLVSAIENAENRYESNENVATTSDAAKTIYNTALATAQGVYENGTAADEEVPAAIKALNVGFTQYVIYDNASKANADNPVDVSKVIVNNDFATMDATGWTAKDGTPGFQAGNGVEAAEFYNTTFNFYQEIEGLPAGRYYLSSRSFYRMGNNPSATLDEDDSTLKYETNENAYVYFSDQAEAEAQDDAAKETELPEAKQTIKPISSCLISESDFETIGLSGTSGLAQYSSDDETKYVVNDMIRAQMLFDSSYGEAYDSEPLSFYYDGQSAFRIGFIKVNKESNDWTIIKNVTLKYAGKDVTGISAAETAGDAVSTKIYTTDGVQVSKLQKGINIVETTMKDGSKKVKKVVVK